MKYLLLITLTFTLFSCGNNKAELAEQIKSAKDSLQLYKNWESFYKLYGQEMETKGLPVYSDKRFLKEVPEHVTINKKWDSARLANYTKSLVWKSRVDSLELELKKY